MSIPPSALFSSTIDFPDFLKVHLHVGTILTAKLNPKACKPSYILTIDFGPQLGHKTSSAQITQHYTPDDLIGTQVMAVTNFAPKRVAGVKSEVLVLAAVDAHAGTVLLRPTHAVANGTRVF